MVWQCFGLVGELVLQKCQDVFAGPAVTPQLFVECFLQPPLPGDLILSIGAGSRAALVARIGEGGRGELQDFLAIRGQDEPRLDRRV